MTTSTILLPENSPTYSFAQPVLGKHDIIKAHQGATAVESTYSQPFPWISENALSSFQDQVPDPQPIPIIPTMNR